MACLDIVYVSLWKNFLLYLESNVTKNMIYNDVWADNSKECLGNILDVVKVLNKMHCSLKFLDRSISQIISVCICITVAVINIKDKIYRHIQYAFTIKHIFISMFKINISTLFPVILTAYLAICNAIKCNRLILKMLLNVSQYYVMMSFILKCLDICQTVCLLIRSMF